MRKYLMVLMAAGVLGALLLSGVATAEKAVVENVEFEANGKFQPKKLPKKKMAPIALTAEGKIKTNDGTHPPAIKEVILETDKNGTINVKGYPKCTSGKLQAQDTKHATAACKKAIIGEGTTTAEVALPEQRPISVNSKLLVINGGVKGGKTTLFIHAYFSAPVSGAIVTTVKIKKVHNGRYGIKSVATIPKIAGGNGSVTSFRLKIDKKFTYKGKRVSILSAKCPDGRLQAHATAVFDNGIRATTDFVRPCTGKN